MAILAMDQYAHVLAERIAGATLVEEPGAVAAALGAAGVAVLAPYRWMRAADVLPHSWEREQRQRRGLRGGGAGCRPAGPDQAGGRVPDRTWWTDASAGAAARAAMDRDRLEAGGGAGGAGLGFGSASEIRPGREPR